MSTHFLLSLLTMIAGFIFGIFGLVLLARQKFAMAGSTEIIVEIPMFGRMKANYPSLVAFFIGVVLIFYSVQMYYSVPSVYSHETMPIKGNVKKDGARSHEGIMIGVVPGRYTAYTDSDGNFTVNVVVGESSYTGIAYYKDSVTQDVHISGVKVEHKEGTFGHVFGRVP